MATASSIFHFIQLLFVRQRFKHFRNKLSSLGIYLYHTNTFKLKKITMKLLSTLLLLLFFQCSFANTYFISPKGSDDNGNGTISNPWRSLYKATSSVTTPGNIIHVMAGTYTETNRSSLAIGVSIEGDGAVSIIQSTLSQEFAPIIAATSPQGTDGNQHISNIKLDGNNRTTSWAIEIRGRKNISIHDCIITDFEDRGIVWAGREGNEEGAPEKYATGNSFYNNTVTNCAKYDGYGRGCLNIGGQEGMLIYNNTIAQTGRPKGTNGWPIKHYNGGFLKGCKIYNNIITKEAYDGTSWDFAIELFNEAGLEIYGNTVIGSIDVNHQTKGGYAYSVYIHDNIIGPQHIQSRMETGIILEYETDDAIIENNHLKNLGTPVNFNPREGNIINDVTIKNNVCDNIGVTDGSHHGFAVNFFSGSHNYFITNFFVLGNKFIANTNAAPYYGIGITGVAFATNIILQNNTIKNFSVGCVTANPAFAIDTMVIFNNTLSGNGNGNEPFYIRGMPNNYTLKNNTKSGSDNGTNPGFNLKEQIIRPLYYEIKNTGMLLLIAAFAGILGFLFCSKENIYVFPVWLISRVLFSFLNFDQRLNGEISINVCFILLCIYGWVVWAKRDRRKHRIVRVTDATKKEWFIQWAFFTLAFIIIFFTVSYFKKAFMPGASTWKDAVAIAASLTGMWLITRKKVEAWYWLIAANIILFTLYYSRNYLLMGLYCCALLAMCFWGLYKWNKRKNIKRRRSSNA